MATIMVDQILINGMTIGVSKGRCRVGLGSSTECPTKGQNGGVIRVVLVRLISISANEEPGVMGTPIDYFKAQVVFGEGAMHVQCVP